MGFKRLTEEEIVARVWNTSREYIRNAYAEVDRLEAERGNITRVDNQDGTETWHGVPLVLKMPAGREPQCIRPPQAGDEYINMQNVVAVAQLNFREWEVKVILAPRPEPVTWKCPASLPDGEYKWDGALLQGAVAWDAASRQRAWRDWTDPPQTGTYRVVDGVGTLIEPTN